MSLQLLAADIAKRIPELAKDSATNNEQFILQLLKSEAKPQSNISRDQIRIVLQTEDTPANRVAMNCIYETIKATQPTPTGFVVLKKEKIRVDKLDSVAKN